VSRRRTVGRRNADVREDTSQGVGARTLRGMAWAYGSFASVRLSSLLAVAILARLLAPKDFGLIALATTFMAFLDVFQGLGVGNALVVTRNEELDESADNAFVLSVLTGFMLWAIAAALGPVAAATFGQHRLIEVMPVLGSTFFLDGLSATHYSLALRQLNIRARTAAEITEAVVRGAIGVALALAGFGVWSLIVGYVAGSVGMVLVIWRLVSWRPRLRLNGRISRRLLAYGGALTGVGVTSAFASQFDNAVVGRVLGSTQLGFYSIAGRLPALLIVTLASACGDVLFPAFAQLDAEALSRAYVKALRYTSLAALPLTAILITLARPITFAVFGSQWGPSIAATQVLCLWALMSPISMVCGNVLKARGHATLLLVLAVPQVIGIIVGSLLLVRDGIVVLSWMQAVIAIAAQVVTLMIARHLLATPAREVLDALVRPLLAAGALAVALLGVKTQLHSPWPTVVVGGIVSAIIYPVAVRLLMPHAFGDLMRIAFRKGASPQDPSTDSAIAETVDAFDLVQPHPHDPVAASLPTPTRPAGS
jgi:O-antigen/teichoic acid export membrane protein